MINRICSPRATPNMHFDLLSGTSRALYCQILSPVRRLQLEKTPKNGNAKSTNHGELWTTIYPPRMAPFGLKLRQNAFQARWNISCFDPKLFFSDVFFRFFSVSKLPKNWKLPILEELGIFRHHRRVRLEKWPPMKRFSGLYDFWRRGKRWHFDFFLDFWPKIIFTISRKWCCITKMPVASRLSGVQTNSPQKDFDVARNLLQKTFSRKFFTLRRTVFFYKRFFPLGIFLQRFFFQKLFFPLGIFFPREAFFFFEERWLRLGYREPLSLSSSAEPQS